MKIKYLAIASCILLLGSFGAYKGYQAKIFYYREGLHHLLAGNFEDASSLFRLHLRKSPEQEDAKGLLAYSVLRSEIANQSAENGLVAPFIWHYFLFNVGGRLKSISDKETREQFEKLQKEHKEDVKKALRQYRIPFRDWNDLETSIQSAAKKLFGTEPPLDDKLGVQAKSIAAALLAKDGNREASKYLVQASVQDPDVLALTLVSGEKLRADLAEEAKRDSSFITDETRNALRLLDLVTVAKEFIEAHPKAKTPRESDIPKEHLPAITWRTWPNKEGENKPLLYVSNEPWSILVMFHLLQETKFNPYAFEIASVELESGRAMTALTTFDSVDKRFITSLYYWNGQSYESVQVSMSQDGTNPTGTLKYAYLPSKTIEYDKEKKLFCMRLCKMGAVGRTREEVASRSVTRYTTHLQYSSYRGFYEVRTPYKSEEVYLKTVKYDVKVPGEEYRYFTWHPEKHKLNHHKTTWVADNENKKDILKD